MDSELKSYLDRINTKLTKLIEKEKKPAWVKVSTIKEMTRFKTKEQRRVAKECGILIMRKAENGIEYDLNAIPEKFFVTELQP